MKKFAAILLALCMVLSMAACAGSGSEETQGTTTEATTEGTTEPSVQDTTSSTDELSVMTHEEYMAAEEFAPVCVEVYVQNTQSWWSDQISVYAQDENGGYFIYNMVCSEEDAALLTPGTKIQVTGYKAIWSGLNEIAEGATFTFVEDAEPYVAEALDVTAMLGTDELADHQGEKVSFKGMTVEASTNAAGEEVAYLYNWDGSGEEGGDSDLYFKASINGQTYTFVIEYYLCDEYSEPYQAVQNLKVGDVIDMEGFLYWYDGPQAHVTSITVAE